MIITKPWLTVCLAQVHMVPPGRCRLLLLLLTLLHVVVLMQVYAASDLWQLLYLHGTTDFSVHCYPQNACALVAL